MPLVRSFIPSGLIRLCVVLSAIWLACASWLYSNGVNREYNVYQPNWFTDRSLSPAEVARLPTLQEFNVLHDNDRFLDWEISWMRITQGQAPELYSRERSVSSCEK